MLLEFSNESISSLLILSFRSKCFHSYDACVISFQSVNKNCLEHLNSKQKLLSFLFYLHSHLPYHFRLPFPICIAMNKCARPTVSVCWHLEGLLLKSQNHTLQNDETKLITRPFSIRNDRFFFAPVESFNTRVRIASSVHSKLFYCWKIRQKFWSSIANPHKRCHNFISCCAHYSTSNLFMR